MKQKELSDIDGKIMLCEAFIQALKTVGDDPRKEGALEHYEKQLKHFREVKEAREKGLPEPIVIGLKAATLSARPLGQGE